MRLSPFSALPYADGVADDTCVQPGYWAAIAEFIQAVEAEDARAAAQGQAHM